MVRWQSSFPISLLEASLPLGKAIEHNELCSPTSWVPYCFFSHTSWFPYLYESNYSDDFLEFPEGLNDMII